MKLSNRTKLRIVILTACGMLGLPSSSAQMTAKNQAPRNAESESFASLASQAQSAMDGGRLTEAIRLYTRATRVRPSWSEGWWHLGTLCFDSSRFAEGRDAFLHFVEVEKKQPGPGFGMLG